MRLLLVMESFFDHHPVLALVVSALVVLERAINLAASAKTLLRRD